MTDKDRTDEKLWKYVHITRDNRFGLVDTKIGGNLDVTNHTNLNTIQANHIGIDSSGNDASGYAQFTDLSTTSLNVFGDTTIHGDLNVNNIFKKTITEVDININSDLELFHNLDVSGIITGIGGINLNGIGSNDKINNVTIGYDVSGLGKFTDLTSTNLFAQSITADNIGYDVSGKGSFTDLSAQELQVINNIILGDGINQSMISSKNLTALSFTTNSGLNSGKININNGIDQHIDFVPNGSGSILIGNGTNRSNLTTKSTQNLLLDTNLGNNSSLIKIIAGSNGNIQFTPNGTGNILIGDGLNHQKITTNGSKNLTLSTNDNTSTPAIVINAGTVGNIDLKHNTTGMIIIGNGSVSGKITTNGSQDLNLSTMSNNALSGQINIINGTNGNIELLPNGSGLIQIGNNGQSAKITSNGTQDLVLNTNNGINSGTITIEDGINGNIILQPNGSGQVILTAGSIDISSHNSSNGLKLEGTLVTSNAAELNRLDGTSPGIINNNQAVIYNQNGAVNMKQIILDNVSVDLDANELNHLDTAAPGSIVNGKCVIYSQAGKINATQLQLSGSDINASAAEINQIDESAPGIVVNNKCVIYDSNGYINTNKINIGGIIVSSSATEMNLLDGSSPGSIINNKAIIYNNTGDIIANSIIAGNGGALGVVKSNGNYNLFLSSGNTTTSSITVGNGLNSNITLSPNGTGKILSSSDISTSASFISQNGANLDGTVIINNITYPTSDGASSQVIQTDGNGNLSFTSMSINLLNDIKLETNSIYVGTEPSSTNNAQYNSSLGVNSSLSLTTGDYNTSIGGLSMNKNLTGNNNTAIGYYSLYANTSGINNTCIGYESSDTITTGTLNTTIGYKADVSTFNAINEIVIGANAIGHGNNTIVLGDSNILAIHPGDDNSVDLGASSYSFKNLYIDGTIIQNGTDYLSTISNSNITISSGKTLDIQNGTFSTSQQQKLDIIQNIGSDIDIGAFNLRASTITSDISTGTPPLTITSTTLVPNLFASKAATVPVSDTTSTGCYVSLFESSSGDLTPKTDSNISYNASTGTLNVSNLTVSGTTTTINSTTVDIVDPVLTIGANTTDDNFDRGIKFKYNNSGPKIGFFGYDDSDGTFTLLTNATDTNNTFSGTLGTLKANIDGSITNATNSTNITVADTTNANCYISLFESATGNLPSKTDGSIRYNATTGVLTATGIILTNDIDSNITGNSATVTNGVYTSGNQTINDTKTFSSVISGSINGNSSTITVDNTTDTSCYVSLFNDATGNISPKSNTGITYNATTNKLSVIGGIVSSLTGNADTVSNGVYTIGDQTINGNKSFSSVITGSIDGNSITSTVIDTSNTNCFVSLFESATGNLSPKTNTGIIYNAELGTLTTSIIGNATSVTNGVYTTGNQVIADTKTFSSTISGSIDGNSTTVTNGVYSTGNQTISGIKTFSSTIVGSIDGNSFTVTDGMYLSSNQTITGSKTFNSIITGSIDGNAAYATTSGTVTTSAQPNITTVGTLLSLDIDDININGKVITMTGSVDDTITIVAGTNGTLNINTTDVSGSNANITITADGTNEIIGTSTILNSTNGIISFIGNGNSLGTITTNGYSGNSSTVTNGIYTTSSVTELNDITNAGSGIIITSAERTKLSNIQDSANVTDFTSVVASGGVMTTSNQTIGGNKTFSSTISGSIDGNSATSTTSTNVVITENSTTNETVYMTFVDGTSNDQGVEVDNNLTYNPSSGLINCGAIQTSPTATVFSYGLENVMSNSVTLNLNKLSTSFTLPAGAVITDIIGIFTSTLIVSAGTIEVKFGSTSDSSNYLTATSINSINYSKGFNNTGTLGETIKTNTFYMDNSGEYHITVLGNGGNITSGTAKFFIKFIV
jgi:hypothetical protein